MPQAKTFLQLITTGTVIPDADSNHTSGTCDPDFNAVCLTMTDSIGKALLHNTVQRIFFIGGKTQFSCFLTISNLGRSGKTEILHQILQGLDKRILLQCIRP